MSRTAVVLPVIMPDLPFSVDFADLTDVPELEDDASEHWLFDAGDATNLVGRLNGGVLTPRYGATAVRSIAVSSGGTGYATAPTVALTGGGGSGATAVANIAGGVVTHVTVTNGGTGYTSDPTVGFSGGGGSGAVAAATRDALPTYGASSLTTRSGGSNGLASAFDDSATMTLCGVFKHAAISTPLQGRLLLGSLGAAAGGSLYVTNSGINADGVSGFTRPASPVSIGAGAAAIAEGSWYFCAIVWDAATGKARYYAAGLAQLEATVTKTVLAGKVGVGNINYGSVTFDQGTEVAEFIVYEGRAMSFAELAVVYARSKVRCARRGLTVV